MYKISDFARLSRVSAKMLRHYDELGLLKPAHVDPSTDYRFYTAEQLPRLNCIIALKDLGFTLQQVAALLDDDLSVEQLKGMLKLRRAEVAQRLEAEQLRLAQIETRLSQIEREGQLPRYDVVLRPIAAAPVAAARAVAYNDAAVSELLNEVEVDTLTGRVRVLRVVAAHDCGRIMNPLTFRSQIEGGIIQGIGYALTERRVIDHRLGQPLNANLGDYQLPTIADVPEIDVLRIDIPDLVANPTGAKGAGEPPIIPTAAAIANAVADAIGVRIRELPITPEKVLTALRFGMETGRQEQ